MIKNQLRRHIVSFVILMTFKIEKTAEKEIYRIVSWCSMIIKPEKQCMFTFLLEFL